MKVKKNTFKKLVASLVAILTHEYPYISINHYVTQRKLKAI